jgi:LPXTG-motif cell wall-anchored protein
MNKTMRRLAATGVALSLGAGLALGTASTAYAVDTWTITGLTLDNAVVINAADTAGDDGGFLAVTQKYVLLDGDTSVFAYDLATLADFAATDVPDSADPNFNIASDLKTNTAYLLEDNEGLSALLPLDVDGNVTATPVTLSETINLAGSWFVISGFGWIGFWEFDQGVLMFVDPTTGTVTTHPGGVHVLSDYAPEPAEPGEDTGQIKASGVGMFDGRDYWLVANDANGDISKFVLTTDVDQAVMLENSSASAEEADSDNFTISTCSNRFYTQDESPGEEWFGQNTTGMGEALLTADATFSSAGTCPTSAGPELPNTGVDVGAGVALAALLAGLGVALFVVVRRRQVTSK